MGQIEKQKQEFRNKFYESHPLLVDLTLWCLEHKYNRRPKFRDLYNAILASKSENKHKFKIFRSNTTKKFPKVTTGGRKLVPIKKKASWRDLTISSNFVYQKDMSLREIPKPSSTVFLKKEEPQVYSDLEEEDFVVQPEIKQSMEESYFQSEVMLEKSEVLLEKPPFNNDFSGDPPSSIKKSRYRQTIFDESQDIYYREVKKEGLVNYNSLGEGNRGSYSKGNLEMTSSQVGMPLPRRYIKAKHE